jgi:transcription antitermination factor NusG
MSGMSPTESPDNQEYRWIVLRTQPRREGLAAHAVRAQGVESYVPLLPPTRRAEPSVPLFPGYVFARVAPFSADIVRIRCAPGVAYVLPRAGSPALLRGQVVDDLRTRLVEPLSRSAREPLRRGEPVKVVAGPFRWSDALFERYVNPAGRVRVLLEMVNQQVAVELREECLQRVG